MPAIGGLTVVINCHGTDHTEYVQPTLPDSANRRYRIVEAKDGANFSIDIKLNSTFVFLGDVLTCTVTIDGVESIKMCYDRQHISANTELHHSIDEIRDNVKFHSMLFTMAGGTREVSKILVEIKHGNLGQQLPGRHIDLHPEDIEMTGISSTVGIEPGIVRPAGDPRLVTRVGEEADDCYFEFECCTRAALQARGVV